MPVFRKSGAVVVVDMDLNAIAKMTRNGGQVDVFTRAKATKVSVVAKEIVPVKTGRLRGSIKVQQGHDIHGRFTSQYEVSADTPYATFVHEGTRAHVIEGNPLLVFDIGGTTVFTRRVNHPGTKPQPFLVRATQTVIAGGGL